MRNTILFTALLLLVALAASCGGGASIEDGSGSQVSSLANPSNVAGRYIVVLKAGASSSDVSRLGRGLANRPDFSYQNAITGFAARLNPAELARIKADPAVDFVEPDLPVTMAPGNGPGGNPGGGPGNGGGGGNDGGGGGNKTDEVPWGVDRIDAELNTGSGGAGIGVAVFDTGCDIDHKDLANVVNGYNVFSPGSPAEDDNGHGTHVSGTINAAKDNSGIVGVAPNATIVPIKVLNRQGGGSIAGIIAGIDWVIANKATYNIKVGNMSLSAYGSSGAFANAVTALTNAGVTLAVAAGNDYGNAANYIPASYSNVICVTALDPDGTFATYSNNGSVVDVIAPGTEIKSCWLRGKYKTISGTSMATPHVAGAIALLLDDGNPSDSFASVYSAITNGENAPAGGWVGDDDGIAEDLVDAENL